MQTRKISGFFLFDKEDELCMVALDPVGVRLPVFQIDEEQKMLSVFDRQQNKVAECAVPRKLQGRITKAFVTEVDSKGNAITEFEAEVV